MVVIEFELELVWRSCKLWLLLMLPSALVKAPPSMAYSPSLTLMDAATLMPLMVMVSDNIIDAKATSFSPAKLKASGVVSSATWSACSLVVLRKFTLKLPTESTLVTVAL